MEKKLTLKMAMVIAVVMAVLAPVAVIAAGGTFTDDDSSIFEADIEWLVGNGITSGCGTDIYCPDDNVTRGQMAAFMHRLATKKVVDAATAVTAENALHAETAADAGTLDGQLPSEFAATAHTHTAGAVTNGAGVASGFDDSGSLTSSLASVASATITAPSDGYLMVQGDLQLNIFHTNGITATATLGLSLSPTALGQQSQDNAVGVPSGAATGNYFFSPGLTGLFPVTAGDNTVHILGSIGAAASGSFNDATITVLFVPTSYGTVENNDAPTATVADPAS